MAKCFFHDAKEAAKKCSSCKANICNECHVAQWLQCRDCVEASDLRNYALWRTLAPSVVKGAFLFIVIFLIILSALPLAKLEGVFPVFWAALITSVISMLLFIVWDWHVSTRKFATKSTQDVCTSGFPLLCGRSLKNGKCRIHVS